MKRLALGIGVIAVLAAVTFAVISLLDGSREASTTGGADGNPTATSAARMNPESRPDARHPGGAVVARQPSAGIRDLPPPPSTGESVVRGRVVDEVTREGLARSTIILRHPTALFAVRGESSGDGSFTLPGVPGVLDATVLVVAPGFGPRLLREINVPPNDHLDLGDVALRAGIAITGKVVTREGTPIADVDLHLLESQVSIADEEFDVLGMFRELFRGDESLDDAQTIADGTFSFPAAAPGRYTIAAHKAGLQTRFSDVITVSAGAAPPTIEIRMTEGRTARGVVRSESGTPVVGATVAVVEYSAGSVWIPKAQRTRTDDTGRFVFTTVGDGMLGILARAPGFAGGGAENLRASPKEIEIVLRRASRIEGRVFDRTTSKGLPGAVVSVIATTDAVAFEETRSGEDGRFAFEQAPTGEGVTIVATIHGHVMANVADRSLTGADVNEEHDALPTIDPGAVVRHDIPMVGGGTIVGKVTDADTGAPVPNADVTVHPPLTQGFVRIATATTTRTAQDGTFTAKAVGPGKLLVTARCDGYFTDPPPRDPNDHSTDTFLMMLRPPGTTVEVRPGDAATNVTVPLRRGAELEVLVVDPDGKPVPGANVTWCPPWEASTIQFRRSAVTAPRATDATGKVRLRGVAKAPDLLVAAIHPAFSGGGKVTLDTTQAPALPVTITLQKGATITGTLRDASGQPSRRTGLVCEPAGDQIRAMFAGLTDGGQHATTDDDGRFTFAGLPPGECSLRLDWFGIVSSDEDPDSPRPEFKWPPDFVLDPANTTLTLAAGATEQVTLRLLRTLSIEGTVTDAADAPVANVGVNATPSAPGKSSFLGGGYGETDANGHYKIGGLVPGEYVVQVYPKGGDAGPPPKARTVKAGVAGVDFKFAPPK